MLDIRKDEPELILNYPLLIHYGYKEALLYAYLNYYLKTNPMERTPFMDNPYYKLQLKKTDIKQATGLSFGDILDAEMGLSGAGILFELKSDGNNTTYEFHPEAEESMVRWCYKHINKWKV